MKKAIFIIITVFAILFGVLIFNTINLSSKQVASESLENINLPNDVFQNTDLKK